MYPIKTKMVSVINHKDWDGVDGIYVGRPSVLGNPFVIGRDGTRLEVIEKYRHWLRRQYKQGGKVKLELLRLAQLHLEGKNLLLVCWCLPAPCHAEFIKEAIEKIAENNLDDQPVL